MKKEYFKRKSRRVTAMTLALLMSVSIFPQALPKAWAAAPDAEAAESAPEQVVIVEIPAEQTEGEEQIPEPESLVEEAPVEEVKTEESETVEEENTEPTEEEPLETIETAAEGTVKEAPAEKAAENELTAEELEALHDGNYDRFMGSATKIPAAAELDVESFDARKLLVADNAYAKLTDVQKALEDVAAAYANMEAVRALLEGTPEPEAPVMALSVGGTLYANQDGSDVSTGKGRRVLQFTVTSEAPATVSIAKVSTSYKPSGEFIIPSSVEYDGVTYSVTSFGDAAFNGCDGLTSVTIPSSFTSIRAQAFEGCTKITSVIIPSSVASIGENAFNGCYGLTSVTIPSSVTSIGENAFFYCTGLTSVIIEGSQVSIADTAFNAVGNVYVPVTLVIRSDISDAPTGTNPVGWKYGNFNVDFIRPVKIDSNIKNGKVTASPATVQDSATTRTVTLTVTPDSGYELDELYYIAKSAPTDEISIVSSSFSMPQDDVTVYATFKAKPLAKGDSFFTAQDGSDPSLSAGALMFTVTNATKNTVSIAKGTSDPSGTLSIPKTVTYNGIEYTVSSIKDNGFSACDSITSVTIPDSITDIASNAFDSCHWVTSVTIPNSVTHIGRYAFYNCDRLETVTIPNSVTNIGEYAFSKCGYLETVTIPDSVTHIGSDAFSECRNLETVTISNSVTEISGNTFADCGDLTTVIIGKSVTEVRSNAFKGVGKIRAATLILAPESKLDLTPDEDGIITLGKGRFILSYIIAIDSTIQNGTVTTDKTIAKKDETVTVTVTPATGYEPEKLTYKAGTSDPVEIKLKDGKYTFTMPDDNVTVSATFKPAVTRFFSDASGKNTSADDTVSGMVLQYDINEDGTVSVVKKGTSVSGDLIIPESVTFNGTAYTVTAIGGLAFKDCTGLTSLTVPASVTKFGNGVLDGAPIKSLTLLGNGATINAITFKNVGTKEAPVTLCVTSAWPGSNLPTDPETQWYSGYFKVDTLRKVNIIKTNNGTVTSVSPEYVPDSAEGEDRVVTLKCAPNDGYVISPICTYYNGTPNPAPLTVVDPCTITFIMPNKNQDVYMAPGFFKHATHTWVYENGTTDNIIVARCNKAGYEGCKYHFDADAPTLTLTAEDAEFTGSPYTGASVEDNITSIVEGTAPTIMYRGVAPTVYDDSPTAPTEVGTYEAYVTLGTDPDDATAAKQFNIRTPKADTTALEAAVDAAKAAKQADYPSTVWDEILGYVEKSEDYIGKDLPTSAQDEIDALTADLTDALDAKADFSALDDALTNAADYLGSESDYTAASWKDFTDALAEAQSVRSNPATQTAIDSAAKALTDATDALQLTADTTALEKALADAKAAKQADYPSTVWDEIADYVKEAEDSYIGKDLSAADYQDDIDNLTADLKKALADKLADYTAVNAAFDKIPANLSDYDPDSTTELLKAQDAVITGLHVDKQSEVDKFAEDIEKALALLRLKGDKNLISATAPAVLYMGDTAQKVTTETAADGGAVTYSVDGTAVSVGPDGSITVKEPGEATITVKAAANDKYAEGTKNINVTVKKRTQEVKASDLTIADTDSGVTIDAIVSEVAVSGVPALLGKTAKPVFTSSDDSIATVNEDGVITVNKPGKVTISMTLPGNDFYNEVTVPTEVTLTIDELAVIEGSGGKYRVGSKESLTFRSNGVFANFVGVQVDGKDVDASNYTAWEGSTYVKFLTKYLDSLATGKHKLTYVFKNGTCDAYFYIERLSGGNGDSPATGDKSNVVLWTSLLVLSMTGLAAVVIDRKKRGYSTMK